MKVNLLTGSETTKNREIEGKYVKWDNEEALEYIKKINFPRKYGTDSLIKSRDIIFAEMKKTIPDARIESFKYWNELKRVNIILCLIAMAINFCKLLFLTILPLISIFFIFLYGGFLYVSVLRIGPWCAFKFAKNKGPNTGYNIIGEIPASGKEELRLIIGAHYDTKSQPLNKKTKIIWKYSTFTVNFIIIVYGIARFFVEPAPLWLLTLLWILTFIELLSMGRFFLIQTIKNESPGANDNGSGVAANLELIRIFGASPPKKVSLQFAFFDTEEIGFPGSSLFLKTHRNEFSEVKTWMISLDMLAGHFPLHIITSTSVIKKEHGRELSPAFHEVVNKLREKLGDDLKTKVRMDHAATLESDHAAFFFEGIPAVAIESFGPIHSTSDNVDNLNLKTFEFSGNLLVDFIIHLDESFKLPEGK